VTAREIIRVEPLSTYLERWKAPTSAVTRAGGTVYVSGFPPFDPETGEIAAAPIQRQTELVLDQMKLCLETAGTSLGNVLKCTVYCTSVEAFPSVNEVYARYHHLQGRPACRDISWLAGRFSVSRRVSPWIAVDRGVAASTDAWDGFGAGSTVGVTAGFPRTATDGPRWRRLLVTCAASCWSASVAGA
jgi:2-iminobutanoate/2-iminopropanoate deaminase